MEDQNKELEPLKWHTEKRKVKDLIPFENNPRKMSQKKVEDLKKSLEKFNLVEIPAIDLDNKIIAGHQRLKILMMLGRGDEEIDVRVPNRKLTEKEFKEYNIRSNKNIGEWDFDLLTNFDENLLQEVGFESEELDKIFQLDIDEEEFDKEKKIKKIKQSSVKLGDLYQLGDHRLLCGDATKREDIEKLLNGEKIDMIYTDPPYGMNLDTDFSSMRGFGQGKKYRRILGDEKTFNPQPYIDLFEYCQEQFWWGADYYAENIKDRIKGSLFVWDKTEGGISPNYDKQFGSNFEICWSRKKHKRQIIRCLWKGIFGLSNEDIKKRVHPTQKPVKLAKWFIERFSKREQIILDLFGGSGSTLIACEQLKRKCRMMEIEPIYCEIIINRWEQFTGKKVIKLN